MDCSDVLTIPQFTGTCWFNALLMAMLYSDGTRSFFLRELAVKFKSKRKQDVANMFNFILKKQYKKVDEEQLRMFQTSLSPESILSRLHAANKKTFYFDPNVYSGHFSDRYFVQVYELRFYSNLFHSNNFSLNLVSITDKY